ncbi:MAG: tripartite tricarboxylate transporter substrate binding protein [Betaproteobacteria bacterium]|nr:tripartite tricarboxylate transporter substrate binding protein [Betaproteobacteria bacterium]
MTALMVGAPGAVQAQAAFPGKPIRIVTAAVGGTSDFTARQLAQGLGSSFGQQVIVDNRGGASGMIAAQIVAKSPPDGHNLLLFTSPLWLLPLLQDNVPYDPVRDFAPISMTDRSPSVLVVHPSLPVKFVRELIALAKARPGELNYSRASAGGPSHLSAELFKSMAGVNLVQVPYKGGGPAMLALLGGEVELTFASAGAAAAPLKQSRVRALAVTTAEPSRLFPGLPTIAASGLPGFEAVLVNGLFAPVGTPASVISMLNREVAQFLRKAEAKERFFSTGMEAVGSSPAELESVVKSDIAKWGKIIKTARIRIE